MIDYVSMYTEICIPPELFKKELWQIDTTDDNKIYYKYKKRATYMYYYPETPAFRIKGKIITLLHDTQVLNLDDLYGRDVDRFINEFNKELNALFTEPLFDIRSFTPTRLDFCYNIKTDFVDQYIHFFNDAFSFIDADTRKNYTQEAQKEGSCYVKTASEYERNSRKNYTVNFYDKTDRITKQKKNRERIIEDDFKNAKDVLRLEVQIGPDKLNYECKKLKIQRTFGNLCTYDMSLHFFDKIYSTVFKASSTEDYYSNIAAKAIMAEDDKTKKKDAGKKLTKPQEALRILAQNHPITDEKYKYGRKKIKKLGMPPLYCSCENRKSLELLDTEH